MRVDLAERLFRYCSVEHKFECVFGTKRSWSTRVNGTPRLEGMHAATASITGWIEAHAAGGPECLFCGEPAEAFKPLDRGALATLKRLWWCRPCETTWVT